MTAVARAIRSTPWAILPETLEAICAMAERALDDPAVRAMEDDGHRERYERTLEAMAATGSPLTGARLATIRDGVAALPLFGPIFPRANLMTEMSGATSLAVLAADLRVAEATEAVSRILLVVDSPGGVVTGTPEFAGMIAAATKPVTAHISGLGASAAYWIASQAGEIVADRAALLGSIGVAINTEYQEGPDRDGYRQVTLTSSHAGRKRPDVSGADGRADLIQMLDDTETIFIGDVAQGRGVSRRTVIEEFGQGGMLVGRNAVAAGMADRVDTLEGTFRRLARGPARASGTGRRAAALDLELRQRRAGRMTP